MMIGEGGCAKREKEKRRKEKRIRTILDFRFEILDLRCEI